VVVSSGKLLESHIPILYDCGDPKDYADECFIIEVYKKAYAPVIYLMPSEE
jgi:hypothetical protein